MLKTVGFPSTRTGNQTIVDGNEVFSTAGKGVDFSANANAPGMTSELLNWYEEGTWTPTLTFAAPGDLSITYGRRTGWYRRIGNRVIVSFTIATDAFTWTTASGGARLTGLPFTQSSSSANFSANGIGVSNYTKANYTTVTVETTPGTTYLQLFAYGSGQSIASLNASDLPSGTNKIIQGQIEYIV